MRRLTVILISAIVLTALVYLGYPFSKGGYSLTAETSAARDLLMRIHRAEALCLGETGSYQPLEALNSSGCGGAEGIVLPSMNGYKLRIEIEGARYVATAMREGRTERIRFTISDNGVFNRVVD
jgi:hypothetical protein